jgi:hypothetical protein
VIERLIIITGGQTGADQGALRAASAAGVRTLGFAPRGWLTEDGPAPWLAEFGLREHESADYRARTVTNVSNAHALVWYGNPHTPGGRLTLREAVSNHLDHYVVLTQSTPSQVAAWLRGWVLDVTDGEVSLMVAGNRESKAKGIGALVERHLGEVLEMLRRAAG